MMIARVLAGALLAMLMTVLYIRAFKSIPRWFQGILLINWVLFVALNVNYAYLFGSDSPLERVVIPFLVITTVAGFWSVLSAGPTLRRGLANLFPSYLLLVFPIAISGSHEREKSLASGPSSLAQEATPLLVRNPPETNGELRGVERDALIVAIMFWIGLLATGVANRRLCRARTLSLEKVVIPVPRMPRPRTKEERLSRRMHLLAITCREVSRYVERTLGIRAPSRITLAQILIALAPLAALATLTWIQADPALEWRQVLLAAFDRYLLRTELWEWGLFEVVAVGLGVLLALPILSGVATWVDYILVRPLHARRLKLMEDSNTLYEDLMYSTEREESLSAGNMAIGGSSSVRRRPREMDSFGLAVRVESYLRALSAEGIRVIFRT